MHSEFFENRGQKRIFLLIMRALHLRVLSDAHPRVITTRHLSKPASSPPTIPTQLLKIVHPNPVTLRHTIKELNIPSIPSPIHKMVFKAFLNNIMVMVTSLQY